MRNCDKLCLLCQKHQAFKVNFSKYHGICIEHQSPDNEFLECIHCSCLVPVALIEEIKDGNLLSSIKNFVPDTPEPTLAPSPAQSLIHAKIIMMPPSGDSSTSYPCEYCTTHTTLSPLQCHKICKSCFKGKCPLCFPTESSPLCENCQNSSNTSKLLCGHIICDNCSTTGCDLCNFINRPDSLYSTQTVLGRCEYCRENPIVSTCQNDHKLCSECFEQCQLCRFSIRMPLCENCRSAIGENLCNNGHSVCKGCEKNCALCSCVSSVLEPGGSVVGELKNGKREEKKVKEEDKNHVEEAAGQRFESIGTGSWNREDESRKASGNQEEQRGSKLGCIDNVKNHYKIVTANDNPEGKKGSDGDISKDNPKGKKKSDGESSCRGCVVY